MYRNHNLNRHHYGQFNNELIESGDSIRINSTSYIWDRKKNQLILIIETRQAIGSDVSAHLKGNKLILEASLLSSVGKPFRTHLVDRELKNEFEDGVMAIGFSEIKLKYRYRYQLLSCRALDSKIVKVILGYSFFLKE